jgi:hypothetical protein
VLAVEVPSKVDVFLRDQLQLRPGLVYRVELTARCVGQVEQIHATMDSRRFQPVAWPLHREWERYVVQIRSRGGLFRFGMRLQGVGTFQIRDLVVSEVADFDLPAVDTAARGELLRNSDFALGQLDWTLRFPEREGSPMAPPTAWLAEALAATGGDGIRLTAGEKSLLTSGSILHCHYGRTYRITVRGEAAVDDLEAFLVRPGMAAVNNERLPLTFVDGAAVVDFPLTLPEEGMLAEPVHEFALRLRHNGLAPAHITAVELHAGSAESVEATAPRVGIEIADPACVVLGETLTAQVHVAGLDAAAALALGVSDERGEEVARVDVARDPALAGPVAVALRDLPPGWFRISAASPGRELQVVPHDLAVVLPADPAMQRSGFLGMHLGRVSDARQVELLVDLGVRHVRVWECSWARIQPARSGALALPTALVDGYVEAGLEPLLVLGYPPDWASSAPPKTRGEAQKYPPRDIADWEAYVRGVARGLGEQVRYYEIWNEPNGHYLKQAPDDPRPLEAVYAELVKVAYHAIHEEDPDAVVVIGACAGHPSFSVRSMHHHGAADFCDALSYHAYGGANETGIGAAAFAFTQSYLAEWLPQLGRPDLPIIDSESGIKDLPDGPEGAFTSMILAQGLVARQAAGFDRYYFYNAEPRQYPGHRNFQMMFGFDAQPLVALPMLATWDRLLGDAVYVDELPDVGEGVLAYRFRRADGHPVVATWSNGPSDLLRLPEGMVDAPAMIHALGRRVQPAEDGGMPLSRELSYVFPAALLPKLGLGEP